MQVRLSARDVGPATFSSNPQNPECPCRISAGPFQFLILPRVRGSYREHSSLEMGIPVNPAVLPQEQTLPDGEKNPKPYRGRGPLHEQDCSHDQEETDLLPDHEPRGLRL